MENNYYEKKENKYGKYEKGYDYEKDREKRVVKEFLETGILDKEISIQLANVKEEKDLWCLYTLMRLKQKLRDFLK